MALNKNDLKGIFPAIVTPTNDKGEINREATKKLISFLIEAGVHGVVPLGGTGEFSALAPKQRVEFVEAVIEATAGKVPVIAGILSPGFGEARETGIAFKSAGVDAIMLVTPFYIHPTQEGLRRYFHKYTEQIDLPLILYDIPYRTNVSIDPETVRKMADENNQIIGMKACNTSLAYFTRLMLAVEDKLSILSGEEYLFLSHMLLGAKGGILATCNVFPKIWLKMYQNLIDGDVVNARRILFRLVPLLDAAFAEMNPGPLKEAMAMIELDVGSALNPLVKPSADTLSRLKSAITQLKDTPI